MKPGGGTKVTGAKTVASEPTATDKENLVGGGRMLRSALATKEGLKPEITEKPKHDTTKRKKVTLKDKAVQTARGDKILIEVEDLTSEGTIRDINARTNVKIQTIVYLKFVICLFITAGPSENYWEVLAERRRIALEDALEENKELSDRAEKLEEENRVYKEMLDESRALIEVLQDMLGEDGSGINNSLDDSAL
ncbi:geminin DNA replication inhibitor isoform X2 [Halictus rubicundus]|uniref:geminin DNA replication inhibitor isoform X2 n=1 Tax=Halictus rubicundus TaxID=77578 RepID=UPI004037225B